MLIARSDDKLLKLKDSLIKRSSKYCNSSSIHSDEDEYPENSQIEQNHHDNSFTFGSSKNKEIVILPCDLLEPWAPQFIYDQLKKLKIIDKVIFIITLPLN